ncbi:MAG: hypothetical protein ACR2PM_08600 [Hyphomicrobiales bacterium]
MLVVRSFLLVSNHYVPVEQLDAGTFEAWLTSEPSPVDLGGAIEIVVDGEMRLDRDAGYAFVLTFWSDALRALTDLLDRKEHTEAVLAFSSLKFRIWDDGSVTGNYESAGPISKRIFLFASPLPEVVGAFVNAASVFYSSINEASKTADVRFDDGISALHRLQDKWHAAKSG